MRRGGWRRGGALEGEGKRIQRAGGSGRVMRGL